MSKARFAVGSAVTIKGFVGTVTGRKAPDPEMSNVALFEVTYRNAKGELYIEWTDATKLSRVKAVAA